MGKQSIHLFFLILILLILPAALGAEEADSSIPDSFNNLTAELLLSLNSLEDSSVLAVLDIRNSDGRDSALGNYLEERLADFFISNTELALVERNQIGQVFKEWEYSLSGMVSEDSMQEIGNLAGADAVLVGMLSRVDRSVEVNLRILDTESALVLASVNGPLSEPRYLSMYLDIFDSEVLTDEDFFLGRGRDFDRDRAFLDAFFDLSRALEKETGRLNFLDKSFLEFLEPLGSVEFTVGSRQNCTLKVRKDQFQPQHLYNFFFRDGRSHAVWYYDDNSYGWHTNPFFQAVGFASTPEWALLHAVMEAAIMLETRMEMVMFRDEAGAVDFVTVYVPLENLEQLFNNISGKEVQDSGDGYSVRIVINTSAL